MYGTYVPSVQNEYKIIFSRYERISLASFLFVKLSNMYVFIDNRVTYVTSEYIFKHIA